MHSHQNSARTSSPDWPPGLGNLRKRSSRALMRVHLEEPRGRPVALVQGEPMKRSRSGRLATVAALSISAVILGGANALLGACGPFTDVAADAFCPFVLEIFTLGITTGTSPTTYDPTSNVNRLQMAAFLSRTVDGALKRGSQRAALRQFATPQGASVLGLTTVGDHPQLLKSDGSDVWVADDASA